MPPEDSGITIYRTVTIGGKEDPHWPDEIEAFPEAAVILVGRPALFGEDAMQFLEGCAPAMIYKFRRNDLPADQDMARLTRDQQRQILREYRTIVAPLAGERRFESELFDESRRSNPRPTRLKDLGIVYSGWENSRPVAVCGGSSTVSTWGAATWSMQNPMRDDLRWLQDVQGIVEASVVDTPRAFKTVESRVHKKQLLAPAMVWMDGQDLPPLTAWKEALSGQATNKPRIRILVNGKPVFDRLSSYMIPLTVVAWMNINRKEHQPGILQSTCTTQEVIAWIDAFLGGHDAMGPRRTVQPHINGILNDAVRYFNEVGALATLDDANPASDEVRSSRFTLWFREPPSFLPTFRL